MCELMCICATIIVVAICVAGSNTHTPNRDEE